MVSRFPFANRLCRSGGETVQKSVLVVAMGAGLAVKVHGWRHGVPGSRWRFRSGACLGMPPRQGHGGRRSVARPCPAALSMFVRVFARPVKGKDFLPGKADIKGSVRGRIVAQRMEKAVGGPPGGKVPGLPGRRSWCILQTPESAPGGFSARWASGRAAPGAALPFRNPRCKGEPWRSIPTTNMSWCIFPNALR